MKRSIPRCIYSLGRCQWVGEDTSIPSMTSVAYMPAKTLPLPRLKRTTTTQLVVSGLDYNIGKIYTIGFCFINTILSSTQTPIRLD